MAVRKPDGEVGSRPGETQRMETVPVEPLRALAQGRIVRLPRADRIVAIGAAGREDRIRQLRHRNVVALVWKHLPGPCELRIGNDRPVYVETGDLLHGRLGGDGNSLVGAGNP